MVLFIFVVISLGRLVQVILKMIIISLSTYFYWNGFSQVLGNSILLVNDLLCGKIMWKIVQILKLKQKTNVDYIIVIFGP